MAQRELWKTLRVGLVLLAIVWILIVCTKQCPEKHLHVSSETMEMLGDMTDGEM
jgi:hypothetical protein